jgi:hypothetical protein
LTGNQPGGTVAHYQPHIPVPDSATLESGVYFHIQNGSLFKRNVIGDRECILVRNNQKILAPSIMADAEFKALLAELPAPSLAEITNPASNYRIDGNAITHLQPGYVLANREYFTRDFMTQH